MSFLIRLIVNAAALYIATQLVSGIGFAGDWLTLLGVALLFGIVNAIVKPITTVVTLPLVILTLGLFLLVINALMLILTSRIAAWFGLGFFVSGFRAAFLGGLVISIVNALAGFAIKKPSRRR